MRVYEAEDAEEAAKAEEAEEAEKAEEVPGWGGGESWTGPDLWWPGGRKSPGPP